MYNPFTRIEGTSYYGKEIERAIYYLKQIWLMAAPKLPSHVSDSAIPILENGTLMISYP
jgi:hypothetical protein